MLAQNRTQICHHLFFSNTICRSMGLVIQIAAQLKKISFFQAFEFN